MKKLFMFLGAIMLTTVFLFTSCTEENDDPVNVPPSINFVVETGFISGNTTMTINTPFSVKVLATANATSAAKIQTIDITRIYNNQTIWDTTLTFNESSLTLTTEFIALSSTGTENIEFKATDKDGQTAKVTLVITTEEPAGGPIDTWEMRILGSWNNLIVGSSFASINGNVYMLNEAFLNQALIDFIYWEGTSTDATLGAPNDANAILVFNTGPYALSNWATRNATQFKTTTVNAAAFDAIDDATECIDIATGANQTRIGTLAVDQVIAFVTVTGMHGLIKVKAITPGSNGDITIDIKVEK